jgi:hypothetical protein
MAAPVILEQVVTELDIVDTATETDLLSFSVPANTLGTTHALRVTIRADYLNNSAATKTYTLKIKYGATTMYDDIITAAAVSADRYPITIDFVLFPKNATNSQGLSGEVLMGLAGGATTGVGDLGTDEIRALTPLVGANAAEDSTANKDLKVTIQHSAAFTTVSFRRLYYCIEKM